MKIEHGTVVTLSLTIQDTASKTLQRFTAERPTAYLHGYDAMVSALEEHIAGKSAGDTFELTTEAAYGEPSEEAPATVPRKEFPKQWRLEQGMAFFAQGSDGQQMKLYVHAVRGSRVSVSADHPWAGKTVRFTGEILAVRNATEEERDHGHAHGPGGNHH